MNACEEFLAVLEKTLPDMVTTEELVAHGIYTTRQSAMRARKANEGPLFYKINKKRIIYPKRGVIDFLREKQCKI